VAASSDWSRVASGCSEGTALVWEEASGVAVGEPLERHEGSVWSVATTEDGTCVVLGDSGYWTVRVWDLVANTAEAEPLANDAFAVILVAVSADESRIVSGDGDGRLLVWDAATYVELGEPLEALKGYVDSLSVSPDGALIALLSLSEAARVWKGASRVCVRSICDGVPKYATSAELLAAAAL
jgi:WD40 repeat protein